MREKTLVVVSVALWASAITLIHLNFAGGVVEVGRGLMAGYILPFAPFLLAIGLAFVAVALPLIADFGKR